MTDKSIQGRITFIHHDKHRAVIEYIDNGKKKTIQASLSSKEEKPARETHRFLVGDEVSFSIKKTGPNGNILSAANLKYLYNTGLELLVNKAKEVNRFLGYIKITDGKYFIKEIDSYIFFPLNLSAYEIAPGEKDTAQPVHFKLEHIDKPDKIIATLYNHQYIPEFLTAIQQSKKQAVIHATVYNITPFGIYVNLVGDKIKAKIPVDEQLQKKITSKTIGINSTIPVIIKHISDSRIVVEMAQED